MSETKSVLKPHSPGNNWAYYRVLKLNKIAEGFKGCRTMKDFIPIPEAFDGRRKEICSCCHLPVTKEDVIRGGGRGVRGEYRPKTKTYKLMHYDCAWGVTLQAICDLSDRM